MNEFEDRNRALKVDTIATFLRAVHASLPPRLPLDVWAKQVHLPFDALVRASGARPASEMTKAAVLEELAS